MPIPFERINLPSRNTAKQNFILFFSEIFVKNGMQREEYEKTYLQPYSVAGGDGIQKFKIPVRLEKTAAESSKKIKSYLQSDCQKAI